MPLVLAKVAILSGSAISWSLRKSAAGLSLSSVGIVPAKRVAIAVPRMHKRREAASLRRYVLDQTDLPHWMGVEKLEQGALATPVLSEKDIDLGEPD